MQKNFVVYKSSAGSGKTFTLVKEYLKIALSESAPQPQLFKRILAVTFTNKAAAEMKERIIGTLKDISAPEPGKPPLMSAILCDEIGIEVKELSARAGNLLSQILHNYSDFAIGTIDSFTHKIIKTFAFDLKLPVHFNVETDVEDFYAKVVSTLISRVGEDESLTNLLREFSINNADANASWDPEPGLLSFANTLKKEDAHLYITKLQSLDESKLKQVHKALKEKTFSFRNFVREQGQKALQIIKSKQLDDSHFFYQKSGPQNFFKKCADLNFDSLDDLIGSRIKDALNAGKWQNKSNPASASAALDSIIPELTSIGNTLVSYLDKNYAQYSLCSLLEKNIYALLLINELQSITDEFKQEEQVIFISEFNEKISKVVADEPAPFIYERLGERYQHFLIDEFQDTSTLQWQNILPLLDNSLANGRFNLIVGDGKQSIYRWRNANVKQFNALPLIPGAHENLLLNERQSSLERNYGGKVLDTNYRSMAEIVDFNNSLFNFLPAKILSGELQSIYESQSQKKKNESGGFISIDSGVVERDELTAKNQELILKYIADALSSGFTYNDICIITRGNEKGNSTASFLVEQSIPVISSESLLLKNSREISCIISIMNVLINSSDKINSAAVLSYLFTGEKSAELAQHLKTLKQENLFTILNNAGIPLKEEQLARKNVFDICVDITDALQLHLKNPQYIRFFLDEVNDYLVNKTGSVSDFINWWDKRRESASVIIPEGTNAVRIMTIHKSKGLEFPVVIMPYMNWEIFKSQQNWVHLENSDVQLPVALVNVSSALSNAGLGHVVDKEKEEQYLDNLNLLYVGFTRAVERLHIISCKSTTQKKETVADWLTLFISEMKLGTGNHTELGRPGYRLSKHKPLSQSVFSIDSVSFSTNPNLINIKGARTLKLKEENELAIEKGIKAHYILSEIYSEKDITPVLDKMLMQGLIVSAEKQELQLKITDLVNNPLLKNYFTASGMSKNEAEIITENGELLRPDKIIIDNNNAVVIDYKTGKQSNTYIQQMNKYEQALRTIGYTSVKKILVYIEENLVQELN